MGLLRPVTDADIATAREISQAAFTPLQSVFPPLGVPVSSQWILDDKYGTSPTTSWGIEEDGELIAIGVMRVLGTVAILGPIAVLPHYQRQGNGVQLTRACLDLAKQRNCTTIGLETFANSPGHFSLYADLGFESAGLTVHLSRTLSDETSGSTRNGGVQRLSTLSDEKRDSILNECNALSEAHCPGYQVGFELAWALDHQLGETLLLLEGTSVQAFALCCGGPEGRNSGEGLWIRTLCTRLHNRALDDALTLVAAAETLASRWREPRLAIAMPAQQSALYQSLRSLGYEVEEILARMTLGAQPSSTAGIICDDWR